MIPFLNDPDRDVRFAIAASLGRLGDPRAIELLREACNDANIFVRRMAQESLAALIAAQKIAHATG